MNNLLKLDLLLKNKLIIKIKKLFIRYLEKTKKIVFDINIEIRPLLKKFIS